MKKSRAASPKVTCGSCRKFDGSAWCRHWNFHTTAESPPCQFYAPLGRRTGSGPG